MSTAQAVYLSDLNLRRKLDPCSNEDLDGVDLGVVGIDVTGVVQRYDSFESKVAGLSSQRIVGQQPLFTVVDDEVECARRRRWTEAGPMGALNLTDQRGRTWLSP